MASNEIRFEHRQKDERGVFEVVPSVDGTPLTQLIDRFETKAGMQPAGDAYGGLIPDFFRFGPMQDHFHGRSTDAMGEGCLYCRMVAEQRLCRHPRPGHDRGSWVCD
ncbi:hypothetical protein [Streptantibioticus ferralitis]|uniref:Uncharacterized protein n=1 Tax=Streptantibioticus ferralitis TaxID=236510 RepID=A0ABT5ZCH9_9ACTN|nr:hypothetical protein [Streptantibioticus ferralitis]MDF2261551.1 hypothetical protein [Streptantibioticus ferralitis]